MIGRKRSRIPAHVGERESTGAVRSDAGGLQNSMLLMQFRQFCAELLAVRDRLEGSGVIGADLPDVMPSAPMQTATEAAVAAAQAAIASAQAEAAARIAKALGTAPPTVEAPAAADDAFASTAVLQAAEAKEMRARLLALLEQQKHATIILGGSFGLGRLREAQYVMAALGDELILNANWTGKSHWRLLEEDVFQSHASGELFFSKLDALLKMGEAGSIELAAVFFQALALDFRGKFRNNDPSGMIERYRRQIFLRMFQTTPEAALRASITPGAYDSVATGEEVRRLPNPHRWWGAVAAVVLLWLISSFLIWEGLTLDLSHQLERIEAYSHRGRGQFAP